MRHALSCGIRSHAACALMQHATVVRLKCTGGLFALKHCCVRRRLCLPNAWVVFVQVPCCHCVVSSRSQLHGKGHVSSSQMPVFRVVTHCASTSRPSLAPLSITKRATEHTQITPAPYLPCTLQPETYTRKGLPLPLPAHSWHPRHNGKFDAVGQVLPPAPALPPGATAPQQAACGSS